MSNKTMKQEMNTNKGNASKKAKSFDPYAPHKIKWWGWPLLILLIAGTVYVPDKP